MEPRQRGERPVGGAVVDEHGLPVGADALECAPELVEEECDAPLLVVDGDDDGDHAPEPTVVVP